MLAAIPACIAAERRAEFVNGRDLDARLRFVVEPLPKDAGPVVDEVAGLQARHDLQRARGAAFGVHDVGPESRLMPSDRDQHGGRQVIRFGGVDDLFADRRGGRRNVEAESE